MVENEKLPAYQLLTERLRGLIEEIKALRFGLKYASKSAEAACAFRTLLSFLMDMHLGINQTHEVTEELKKLSEIASEYGMGEYAGELNAARQELLCLYPQVERKIH